MVGPSAELREGEAGGSDGGWSGVRGICRGEAELARGLSVPGPHPLTKFGLPLQHSSSKSAPSGTSLGFQCGFLHCPHHSVRGALGDHAWVE